MKWPLAYLCYLISVTYSYGQLSMEDSLRTENLLLKANSHFRSDPDSCVYYAQQIVKQGTEWNIYHWKRNGNSLLGNAYFFNSTYDSAIKYYNKAFALGIEEEDSLLLGAMLNNLGNVYTYKAEYDTSIQILLGAQKIREKIDDPKLSSTVNNLGNAYMRMDDFDRALPYFLEAVELKEKNDQKQSLSNTINNIGIILKSQGKYEEAADYYKKALEIAEEFNDRHKQANAHNNLAVLYEQHVETYSVAEYHYQQAISLKKEVDDVAGLYNTYSNYAKLLNLVGKNREALEYLKLADVLGERIGANLYTARVLRLKAEVLAAVGNYQEAYRTMSEAYTTNTDEMNVDRNQRIAEWETRFQHAQKEAEIEKLTLENSIHIAAIEQRELAIMVISLGGAVILTFLIVILVLRKKKNKLEREAQELQIEVLKKRVMEIQSSVDTTINIGLNEFNQKLHNDLTEREFEILRLSLENKTNTEISEELFISVSTVKFHLRNTYAKLGVNNRKEALDYVVKKA